MPATLATLKTPLQHQIVLHSTFLYNVIFVLFFWPVLMGWGVSRYWSCEWRLKVKDKWLKYSTSLIQNFYFHYKSNVWTLCFSDKSLLEGQGDIWRLFCYNILIFQLHRCVSLFYGSSDNCHLLYWIYRYFECVHIMLW